MKRILQTRDDITLYGNRWLEFVNRIADGRKPIETLELETWDKNGWMTWVGITLVRNFENRSSKD